MSDDLSIQGTLLETTVPDLFRSLIRSGETGVVALDSGGRGDVIYFREGRITAASSTDPDMGVGEILLRTGQLNLEQYNQTMERLVVSRRLGALLFELGYLQPDELLPALELQASEIVLNALAYRHGDYTVDFTTEFPEGITALPLPTERLILDGIRKIEYWSLILRGITRMDRMIEQVPDADSRSFHLELSDEESHILSLLNEPQTVEALCARSYLTNFQTCRTLWGLLTVNLLQDAGEASEQIFERRAAVATEYELEELVEKYNTVYQAIFGIIFQKIGDSVYDFIDRVVLHVAPETMPYLSGMSFVNEARIDVDQLLTNVVASGTTDHAAVVRNILNELLYGWIYETKSEFGPELEAVIVELAGGVEE